MKEEDIDVKIAICDDEAYYLDIISNLIEPYKESEGIEVLSYLSGEDFLEDYANGKNIDIIFLDIEMKGMSGMDVAREIRNTDSNTIIFFVTSHVSFVPDAFRVGAFQFLVKPIDKESFEVDFERAIETYRNTHQYYRINSKDTKSFVKIGDIYYIEGYKRHLHIGTKVMEYECVGVLSDEEEKLRQYGFIRCQQGFLINISKVRELNKGNIIMKNDKVIPLGRTYRSKVVEKFCEYIKKRMV